MTDLPRRGSHARPPLRRLQGRCRVRLRRLQRERCSTGLVRQGRGLRLDLRRGRAGHAAGIQHPLAGQIRRHRSRRHHRRQQRWRLRQELAHHPRPAQRHVTPSLLPLPVIRSCLFPSFPRRRESRSARQRTRSRGEAGLWEEADSPFLRERATHFSAWVRAIGGMGWWSLVISSGAQRSPALLAREILSGCPSTDTRPFRGRAPAAYVGCMTALPVPPIDRVYSSRPTYRQRLWLRPRTFEIIEHLVPLLLEAGRGLPHAITRCSRCSNRACDLLVPP